MNAGGPDSAVGEILFSKGRTICRAVSRNRGIGYHRDESSEAKWIFTVCTLSRLSSSISSSSSSPSDSPRVRLFARLAMLESGPRVYRCPSFRVFSSSPSPPPPPSFPRADELTRNSPEIAKVGWKCPWTVRGEADEQKYEIWRCED